MTFIKKGNFYKRILRKQQSQVLNSMLSESRANSLGHYVGLSIYCYFLCDLGNNDFNSNSLSALG